MDQTSHKLLMFWLRWIGCHPCRLLRVTFFIYLSPHISNNWGCHLLHTAFSLLFIPYWYSFNVLFVLSWVREVEKILFAGSWCTCRAQIYKFYMHSHFCFCDLTGNIVLSSNCRAQIYKSYMLVHFHVCHLIGNNGVSAMHKPTI